MAEWHIVEVSAKPNGAQIEITAAELVPGDHMLQLPNTAAAQVVRRLLKLGYEPFQLDWDRSLWALKKKGPPRLRVIRGAG